MTHMIDVIVEELEAPDHDAGLSTETVPYRHYTLVMKSLKQPASIYLLIDSKQEKVCTLPSYQALQTYILDYICFIKLEVHLRLVKLSQIVRDTLRDAYMHLIMPVALHLIITCNPGHIWIVSLSFMIGFLVVPFESCIREWHRRHGNGVREGNF